MFRQTLYDISTDYYTGTQLFPFQGDIQGNRVVPSLQLIVLIFLVRYLYSSQWVSVKTLVISKVAYQLAGFLYVDDTNIIALNSGLELAEEVMTRAQLLLDRWQYTLQVTGGELKFSKCYWTLQSYSWKNGRYTLNSESLFTILIIDRDKRVPIEHIALQKSQMLVRVEVVPSHDLDAILPFYQSKISQYCAQLAIYPLSTSKILAEYNSFW